MRDAPFAVTGLAAAPAGHLRPAAAGRRQPHAARAARPRDRTPTTLAHGTPPRDARGAGRRRASSTAATSRTPGRGPIHYAPTPRRLPAERGGRRRQDGPGATVDRARRPPRPRARAPTMEVVRLETLPRRASAGRARPSRSATSTASTAATRRWWPRRSRDARASGGHGGRADLRPASRRACCARTRAPAALMTLDQKAELLARARASTRWPCCPFTPRAGRAPSPRSFARERARDALGARHAVVVGADFRFGRGRAGDVAAPARRSGATLGFAVHGGAAGLARGRADQQQPHPRGAGARATCARRRRCSAGRFCVDGAVVRGDGRGRTLGIPTANLAPVNETLPARGVYACRLRAGRSGEAWPGRGQRRAAARPSAARSSRSRPTCSTSTGDLYGARAAARVRRPGCATSSASRARSPGARRSSEDVARRAALLPAAAARAV